MHILEILKMNDHVIKDNDVISVSTTLQDNLSRICCVKRALSDTQEIENIVGYILPCFDDLNVTSTAEKMRFAIYHLVNTSSPYRNLKCENSCETGPPTLPYMLYIGFWIIIMISIILSNLLVIIAMQKTTYIKWHVTNLFLSSLAVSDLLIGIFIVPIKINFALHSLKFCMSVTVCRLYLTSDNILFTVSFTNLFLICIDRYLAINYPYLYPKWFTKKRCMLLVTGTWIYSFIWGILVNIKWDDLNEPAIHIRDFQCQINSNFIYATTTLGIVFLIPVILMGILYIKILQIAKQQARGVHRQKQISKSLQMTSLSSEKELITMINDNNDISPIYCQPSFTSDDLSKDVLNVNGENTPTLCKQRPRSRTLEIQTFFLKRSVFKATRTVAIIYGTFVICWLPVSILSLVFSYHDEKFNDINFKIFYIIFVEILPITNSLLNPFIYAVTNKQYRRAFKKTLNNLKSCSKHKQGTAV